MLTKKNILFAAITIVAVGAIFRMCSIEKERKEGIKALLNKPKTELELKMEAFNKRKKDSIIKYSLEHPPVDEVVIKKVGEPSVNVLKFSSSFSDFEDQVNILQTNIETSYHTFDFDKKIITQELPLRNGGWKTTQFKWTKISEPYSNGYIEFDIVNDKGIYQVWQDVTGAIGYEFYNNTKLVFHDVRRVK